MTGFGINQSSALVEGAMGVTGGVRRGRRGLGAARWDDTWWRAR